ncbi:MAG: acetyltransferase [Ferruginibacter sp.]|uniref:acyltransferase n=1 Tax=Ferruginibacter sp. TaxID=1940288 RepID=UPI0026597E19|nr:acyltransferase [Ferruginibacter sp.]MDB5280397.1 acetyltransferase [Ferruginibacter sp.]
MSNKKLYIKFAIRTFFAKKIQYARNLRYRIKGYDVHPSVIFERKLHLDRLYPAGIHIKENCLIASGTTILSHDHCKRVNNQPLLADTYIGRNCFIAVGAIILPGVKIGNGVIVGAGSVVTKDVPDNCIVAGNPARVIREEIRMNSAAELMNWSIEKGWF